MCIHIGTWQLSVGCSNAHAHTVNANLRSTSSPWPTRKFLTCGASGHMMLETAAKAEVQHLYLPWPCARSQTRQLQFLNKSWNHWACKPWPDQMQVGMLCGGMVKQGEVPKIEGFLQTTKSKSFTFYLRPCLSLMWVAICDFMRQARTVAVVPGLHPEQLTSFISMLCDPPRDVCFQWVFPMNLAPPKNGIPGNFKAALWEVVSKSTMTWRLALAFGFLAPFKFKCHE